MVYRLNEKLFPTRGDFEDGKIEKNMSQIFHTFFLFSSTEKENTLSRHRHTKLQIIKT